jgi:hypothetical protein
MIHVSDNKQLNSNKKGNDSSAAFENLMASRKMDDKFIKQAMDNSKRFQ